MFKLKRMVYQSAGMIVLLIVLLVAGCSQQNNVKENTQEPIKIGAILALTGPASTFGLAQQKIVKLALDEINLSGGVDGRELVVVWQDGKCSPKESLAAAQHLVNVERVKLIIGGSCSGETLGAAPFVEENKVIWIAPSSTSPKVTQAGDYIFRTCPSDIDSSHRTAELIDKLYDNVGIISANTDFSRGWAEHFSQRFNELGCKIVSLEFYNNINETDFRTQILKSKSFAPQAILLTPQTPPVACLLAKQVREIDKELSLIGNQVFTTGATRRSCPQELEDMITAQFEYDINSTKTRSILDKYESTYNEACPAEDQSLTAHDAVYLVKEALEECGENNECIKEFLYSVKDWQGASGIITMDENGDPKKDFVLKKIKGGELVSF